MARAIVAFGFPYTWKIQSLRSAYATDWIVWGMQGLKGLATGKIECTTLFLRERLITWYSHAITKKKKNDDPLQ